MPAAAVAGNQQLGKKPQELSAWQYQLSFVLIPTFLCMCGLGMVGLLILTDVEQQRSISHTKYAELYRWLSSKNIATTAFLVNGGLLGVALTIGKLREHQQAVKERQAAQTSEAEASTESKKAK